MSLCLLSLTISGVSGTAGGAWVPDVHLPDNSAGLPEPLPQHNNRWSLSSYLSATLSYYLWSFWHCWWSGVPDVHWPGHSAGLPEPLPQHHHRRSLSLYLSASLSLTISGVSGIAGGAGVLDVQWPSIIIGDLIFSSFLTVSLVNCNYVRQWGPFSISLSLSELLARINMDDRLSKSLN